jgi:hypothetical protein
MVAANHEDDFPKGHPARFDYDPASPEAKEWARRNISPKGERAFPVDHVKAPDSKVNDCATVWRPGVDPAHPEKEEFTGASPEVAAARRAFHTQLAKAAQETPMLEDGRVNVAAVAEKTALDFLAAQGHDEEAAAKILREQGVDKILAAKAAVTVKE